MEEALTTLRTAITQILNEDPTEIQIECPASSEPSNISSLSGSHVSRKILSHMKPEEERGRLMDLACTIEHSLAELDGVMNTEEEEVNVVDLLVTVIISVPNALFQKLLKLECSEGVDGNQCISTMEGACFHNACLSADIIIRWVLNGNVFGSFTEAHVQLLVEKLTCCDPLRSNMNSNILFPIVEILNAVTEQRSTERLLFEQGCIGQDFDYQEPPPLFHMSAKETLRMIQMMIKLMHNGVDSFHLGHVGLFTSNLLNHFAETTLVESGHTSFDECQDLFRVWTSGGEHMTRRLSDGDANDVLDLVIQFHIDNVQLARELIKSAGAIASSVSDHEMNEGKERDEEQFIAVVHDCVRRVDIAVSVTEVMEKLGLEFDPQIDVIFHPMLIEFSQFVASGLHEALVSPHISLRREEQVLSHLADGLLLRMCNTVIGTEFLKHCDDGERNEVLISALLRALSSGSIPGKGQFLLDIAVNLAQTGMTHYCEPTAKRPCYGSQDEDAFYSQGDSHHTSAESSSKVQQDMASVLIMCMTLSQTNLVDTMDQSKVKQVSAIASSMLGGDDRQHTLDLLNPWHSLNIDPLKEFISRNDSSISNSAEQTEVDATLSCLLSSVPCCSDTGASSLSI